MSDSSKRNVFCTQCGSANDSSSNFCFNCGKALVKANVPPPAGEQISENSIKTTEQIPSAPKGHSERTKRITSDVLKLTGVRGWLKFAAISLLVLGPLATLSNLWASYSAVNSMSWAFPAFEQILRVTAIISAVDVVWSITLGVFLMQARPGTPTYVKWYLVFAPVLAIIGVLIIDAIPGIPKESLNAMQNGYVQDILKVVVTSTIWFLYFAKSKRVLYTFPNPKTHVRCPECRGFVYSKSASCPHCKTKLIPEVD